MGDYSFPSLMDLETCSGYEASMGMGGSLTVAVSPFILPEASALRAPCREVPGPFTSTPLRLPTKPCPPFSSPDATPLAKSFGRTRALLRILLGPARSEEALVWIHPGTPISQDTSTPRTCNLGRHSSRTRITNLLRLLTMSSSLNTILLATWFGRLQRAGSITMKLTRSRWTTRRISTLLGLTPPRRDQRDLVASSLPTK